MGHLSQDPLKIKDNGGREGGGRGSTKLRVTTRSPVRDIHDLVMAAQIFHNLPPPLFSWIFSSFFILPMLFYSLLLGFITHITPPKILH